MPEPSLLYPTKTRLALVRAVANGQVATDVTADDDLIWLYPNYPTEHDTRRRVTHDVRELERAGWVEEDQAGVFWRLTGAGRAVLANA